PERLVSERRAKRLRVEVRKDLRDRLISQRWVDLQAPLDYSGQKRGNLRVDLRSGTRSAQRPREHDLVGRAARVGQNPCRHLVEDDSQGEDVRAPVELLALDLLGSHVE